MKPKKYYLGDYYKQIENTYDYEITKEQIAENGYLAINFRTAKNGRCDLKVFTPKLAYLFEQNYIDVYSYTTKKAERIKVNPILEIYADAFVEGEVFYKEEYYAANEKINEKALSKLWSFGFADDWNFVKKESPLILTKDVVRKYGFYSGLVSMAELLKHIEVAKKTFMTELNQTESGSE